MLCASIRAALAPYPPAMHHTLRADRPNLHAHFRPDTPPALTIDSGDSVTITGIPDVSWGLQPPTSTTAPRRKVEPRDPAIDNGPCLCGPIAVRGAEPGDTLAVTIVSFRTSPWGWTYAGKGVSSQPLNSALGLAEAPLTLLRWTIDQDRGMVTNQHAHTVPLRPFPGCLGLAAAPSDSDDGNGWRPRASGGNMDCRELVAGCTLHLPVHAAGGLLSIGDGHAAQADGELSGTGIECMIEEARLGISLSKGRTISAPRIRPAPPSSARWISLGFGPTLDAAAERAAAEMLEIMTAELRISRAEALALASSQVDLRVTQMVNPHRGVHAVWRG